MKFPKGELFDGNSDHFGNKSKFCNSMNLGKKIRLLDSVVHVLVDLISPDN